jgi:hypothetical protein
MSDRRMGQVFDQGSYGSVPLPDPRKDWVLNRELARDAGVEDIRSNYGPNVLRGYSGTKAAAERAARKPDHPGAPYYWDMVATTGVGAMATPERFHDVQTGWPESPNAVWMFDDRFRGM